MFQSLFDIRCSAMWPGEGRSSAKVRRWIWSLKARPIPVNEENKFKYKQKYKLLGVFFVASASVETKPALNWAGQSDAGWHE